MKPTLDEKPQVPITQDLKRISDISSNGFGHCTLKKHSGNAKKYTDINLSITGGLNRLCVVVVVVLSPQ